MTTADGEYSKAKTSVWWDIENCEVPKGWDAHAIAQNVSSALLNMNYGGPVSISAYGDTNLIPHAVQQALSSTGVGLNHVPAGVKDASDKKILVDMLLWAVDNPAPANFMLISGDRDFSNALHQLSMRRYTILLAQPPRASAPLVAAAKNVWLWTSLASGGPPLTSVESSRLVNSGRGLVSNHEAAKDPVSEQAQSSKTTGSTSVPGDTKDPKTSGNHVPSVVPKDKSSNMVHIGRGATDESAASSDSLKNVAAQESDKRHASQTSVKTKPVQEPKILEPVLCSVCQISCASKDAYISHTYGKRHRNNLELQSSKSENMSRGPVGLPKEVLEKQKNKNASEPNGQYHCRLCNVTCQRQVVFDSHLKGQKHAAMLSQSKALIDSKKLHEKVFREKDQPREAVAEPKSNANYACRLCNVVCQSQIVLDSHLKGQKHASMLSQTKELIASKKLQKKGVEEKGRARETIAEPKPNAVHVCSLCNVTCQSSTDFDSHLRGQKHAAMLSQLEELIESKKLQAKGVGEKDQLREAIVESQLQSHKAHEKQVAMVNHSEALISSRKLEEKVVQEKVQPIETILEPQSKFQNPQDNTKFLEPSREVREICDTTKSSLKEKNSSTKDWVETAFFGDVLCHSKAPEEARECFDGIVKPVSLSGGATEKEKEVMVSQEIPAINKIYGSQGLSTVVCDIKSHGTNKNHTTPGFVASDDTKSSVSTKHRTKEPNVWPLFCHVCQISCDSKVALANHIFGKIHQQKMDSMSEREAILAKENAERLEKILSKAQAAYHDAVVKKQSEALIVDSVKAKEEHDQERETTEDHRLVKTIDHVFQGAEVKDEVKEINHISESTSESITKAMVHAFTELNQESSIPKELRMPADVNVTEKLEHEHKELPGEAAKREEPKVQVDNFWTRLWGKKN